MVSATKCPICEREVKITTYRSEGRTEEEHLRCEMCGYEYEFVYGNHRELIEGVEYGYTYSSSGLDDKGVAAYHKAKRRWRNGSMTFKGMLTLIFRKSVKPAWYLEIPWYKRFGVWRRTYANPLMVIKAYIRSKRK